MEGTEKPKEEENKITRGNKSYCNVFGCLRNSRTSPDLSFFCIPVEENRFRAWLYLIDREDLMNKPGGRYRVCEIHFEQRYIQANAKRKVLKKNALPSLHLPQSVKLKKEKAVQVDLVPSISGVYKLKCNETENFGKLFVGDDDVISNTSLYCDERSGALLNSSGQRIGEIEESFHCNVCQAAIKGFRYTCVQCDDWDMCGGCEASGAHASHYILRVPAPRPSYTETQALLTRIRQELRSCQPPIVASEDQVELKPMQGIQTVVKVDVDELPDPGSDPLVETMDTARHEAAILEPTLIPHRTLAAAETNTKNDWAVLTTISADNTDSSHYQIVPDTRVLNKWQDEVALSSTSKDNKLPSSDEDETLDFVVYSHSCSNDLAQQNKKPKIPSHVKRITQHKNNITDCKR